MRRHFAALLMGLMLLPGAALAERLVAHASIESQKMNVYHEGRLLYAWQVSTAKPGSITPVGTYRPKFLSRNHRSKRYNNAPMPFAIFYDGNCAIHGTDQITRLGKPASHGCVRLDPKNAEILFEMVKAEGMENTRVVIVN